MPGSGHDNASSIDDADQRNENHSKATIKITNIGDGYNTKLLRSIHQHSKQFQSKISIEKSNGKIIDAKRLFQLLEGLDIKNGDSITIRAIGKDSREAVDDIVELILGSK